MNVHPLPQTWLYLSTPRRPAEVETANAHHAMRDTFCTYPVEAFPALLYRAGVMYCRERHGVSVRDNLPQWVMVGEKGVVYTSREMGKVEMRIPGM